MMIITDIVPNEKRFTNLEMAALSKLTRVWELGDLTKSYMTHV